MNKWYSKRVALDELSNGTRVSTVQLPGCYETMLFPKGSWLEIGCWRTDNLVDAQRNHARALAQAKGNNK